jgi:4-diphosphocytidyl-2-C-methyl-D-erythritol kinase
VRVRAVTREAHAKLNVFLRVLGVREDGYHELESLVLPLSLADSVVVEDASSLEVEVHGDPALAEAVVGGGMNLGLVAALALADSCGVTRGARVEIVKRIPVAAGLGGGSADGAAVLLALNELWGCGLALEDLLSIGERVGSDVPALLPGGPVLVRGRGERVERIPMATTWWVLRPFDFPTRSPDAYRWWDEDGAATGSAPTAVLQAAARGDLEALGAALASDLEGPVCARHPEIAVAREELLDAGALGAVMSGSGPTVVALARDRAHAHELAQMQPGAFVATGPPDRRAREARAADPAPT